MIFAEIKKDFISPFPFHRVQNDRSDISDVLFLVTLKFSYVQNQDDINERLYSLAQPFLKYIAAKNIQQFFLLTDVSRIKHPCRT